MYAQWLWEKSQENCFSFFIFSRWLTNHMLLWWAWSASLICSKEATYPGHMLIRFWCDSDITFSRGLHKNLVTVLYFSIINVLCGVSGDASFAPQANLVQAWNLRLSFNVIIDRGPPVTPTPPPRWGFFPVVIFEASEYGPIEIRLFASKLLGLNMLKYAN